MLSIEVSWKKKTQKSLRYESEDSLPESVSNFKCGPIIFEKTYRGQGKKISTYYIWIIIFTYECMRQKVEKSHLCSKIHYIHMYKFWNFLQKHKKISKASIHWKINWMKQVLWVTYITFSFHNSILFILNQVFLISFYLI